MGRDVIISIDGNNVNDEGKRRSVSIVTQGVYDKQNGVHTLRYTEQDEESGENVETTILVEGDRVVVSDDLSLTQITFQRGQRFSSIVEDSRQVPMEFGVFVPHARTGGNERIGRHARPSLSDGSGRRCHGRQQHSPVLPAKRCVIAFLRRSMRQRARFATASKIFAGRTPVAFGRGA